MLKKSLNLQTFICVRGLAILTLSRGIINKKG